LLFLANSSAFSLPGVSQAASNAKQLSQKFLNERLFSGNCYRTGGEHGGDPSSVEFCHKIGLDYVSCSPFRVPIARIAAAQAAINNK